MASKKAKTTPVIDSVVVSLNYVSDVFFDIVDNSGVYHRVKLNGNATHLRGKDMGILPTAGAVGLTLIKREEWEAIKAQYSDYPLIKNGLLWGNDNRADAADEAEDRKGLRNGAEPVDTSKVATTAVEV